MIVFNKKIKISFLDMDEHFLHSAEGIATTGSVNIDGASAIRRTCQLTFSTQDISAVDYFELYKTKFKLEVDLGKGYIGQGVYLLTSFSSSLTTNNFTFNISGKDKMCLLNGEHGGSFSSSIDVGKMDEISYSYKAIDKLLYEPNKYYRAIYDDDGIVKEYELSYIKNPEINITYYERTLSYISTKIPVKKIITNLLTEYAHEKIENISIYDLDIEGLELLEYRGMVSLYLYRETSTGKINNMTINEDEEIEIIKNNNLIESTTISELNSSDFYPLSPIGKIDVSNIAKIKIPGDQEDFTYNLIKVNYGDSLGYRDTDLVYAGDLIANINENIVSVLDKIKNMLGNYEYFYDVDGKFIFKKRQDYVNNDFTTVNVDGLGFEYVSSSLDTNSIVNLCLNEIISLQRQPQIMNVKNDFSIWGNRQGSSGQLPVHCRIAIHEKPDWYVSSDGIKYIYDPINPDSLLMEYIESYTQIEGENDISYSQRIQRFKNWYNKYFTAIEQGGYGSIIKVGDWREIIYQMAKDYYNNHTKEKFWEIINSLNENRYNNCITTYEDFYADMLGFWRQLYFDPLYEPLNYELPIGYLAEDFMYEDNFLIRSNWHKDVYINPSGLNFWFDFIVPQGDFAKFSIKDIGIKGKYLNDSQVKSVVVKRTPPIKIVSSEDWSLLGNDLDPAYSYLQLGGLLKNSYTISSQGVSALTKIQDLLFQHIYVQESITLSIIPRDDLRVNTRIRIEGFKDDFTISKLTMPLQYNGAMSITLSKIPPVLTTETIRKEFE